MATTPHPGGEASNPHEEARADGRRHLPLMAPPREPTRRPWDRARWPVLGLSLGAAALFVSSLAQPWWGFMLYAPQYPGGLRLVISLRGMQGDVQEIDLLNHYIGMGHLADAAPLERKLAAWGVAAIAVVTMSLLTGAGKRLNRLVAVPALSFPVMFLLDSFYWLYTFGHELNPKAPLRIKPFTPEMFGNGIIGQFETFAAPQLGFYLALAGVACALLAALLRRKVCEHCERADGCGAACPRAMVLPDTWRPAP